MRWTGARPVVLSSDHQALWLIRMDLHPQRLALEKQVYMIFAMSSKIFHSVNALDLSASDVKAEHFYSLMSKFPEVEELVVHNINDRSLELIASICPSIKSIRSTSSSIIYSIANLLNNWPNLEEVILSYGIIDWNPGNIYPLMKSFSFREYRDIDNDDEFSLIMTSFPNLQKLLVQSNPMFDGLNDWRRVSSQADHERHRWHNIRVLYLDQASLAGISQLSRIFPQIRELSIKRNRISEEGARFMAKLFPNIESILLEELQSGANAMLKHILLHCKYLRSIHLKYCSSITLVDLAVRSETMKLEEFIVDECTIATTMTSAADEQTIRPIESLKKLTFVNTFNLSAEMVYDCAKLMVASRRSTIKLINCPDISKNDIMQLNSLYPHIRFAVESVFHR
jgi:hypothetical protein